MIAHADQSDPKAAAELDDEQARDAARRLLRALVDAAGELGIEVQPQKLLIDGEEASRLLSMSESYTGLLARAGDIPSVEIGSLRMYEPAALKRWVADGCPTKNYAAAKQREGEAAKTSKTNKRSKAAD
jgi:hypothetical protein